MISRTSIVVLILLTLAAARISPAQPEQSAGIDPTALVRRAVQHRMDAAQTHHPLRYLLRKTDEERDTSKDIIETNDGDVARLVALNGQPLSAEADRAELDRLHTLS